MDRRLRLSVALSLAVHGPLVAAARHRRSYDAYVHMFLADHYRAGWWELWEPRWYGGFSVASYPPLVHQVVALLARVVGLEVAYGLLLLVVLAALPLAIYAFARIFLDRGSSTYAAVLGAGLPGICVSAHAFGQLPTLAALLAVLLTFASLDRFLRDGRAIDRALTVGLAGVVGATHHGTLLLLPLGGAAVAVHALAADRLRVGQTLVRLLRVVPAAAALTVLVVWPFWEWGLGQTMQTPIDHLSRHNLLHDAPARRLFFWAMYGPLALLVPLALWIAVKRKHLVAGLLFAVLFLLGLGGTTPLPRWLFGSAWAWLTYDRFTLWAGVTLLLFGGAAAAWLEPLVEGWRGVSWSSFGAAILAPLALVSVLAGVWAGGQPPRLDMEPMVEFLAERSRTTWRYLTFGFGDQMARLSVLTPMRTMDGNYHTARRLPELCESGIGKIDTAFWSAPGLDALDPILERADERGVRWGFVHREEYEAVLAEHGWLFTQTLANGVEVWLNSDATAPATSEAAPETNLVTVLSWGLLPLLVLTVTGALAWARLHGAGARALDRARSLAVAVWGHLHHLAVGLLPVALCFWTHRVILRSGDNRVYLTYDAVLVYLSDGAALVAVAAWGGKRLVAGARKPTAVRTPLRWILMVLAVLAACSAAWSTVPALSLYAALQLGLVLVLFLSLADDPEAGRYAAVGGLFALLLQSGIAVAEFGLQSSAFLAPLDLTWPGILDPEVSGVSVVELADGARWLRAYGTLPHPNILGGWLLALMAAPLALFLRAKGRRWWLLAPVSLGTVALLLSFSRSAWLGAAAAGAVMLLHHRRLRSRRLLMIGAVVLVSALIVVVPFRALFYTRLVDLSVPTEARSIRQRGELGREAANLIKWRPLLGTGIGAFVPTLIERSSAPVPAEPVHNVLRLATAELGIGGGLLVLAAAAAILARVRVARSAAGVVLSAAVVGVMVAALFDHYIWSLPPGRTMFSLLLGTWAGEVPRAERSDRGVGKED